MCPEGFCSLERYGHQHSKQSRPQVTDLPIGSGRRGKASQLIDGERVTTRLNHATLSFVAGVFNTALEGKLKWSTTAPS